MKCLTIARLQDFALNTPDPLPRGARLASTNPPLEIPAYGPVYIPVRLMLDHWRSSDEHNPDSIQIL